jgi:hypothetical protein
MLQYEEWSITKSESTAFDVNVSVDANGEFTFSRTLADWDLGRWRDIWHSCSYNRVQVTYSYGILNYQSQLLIYKSH